MLKPISMIHLFLGQQSWFKEGLNDKHLIDAIFEATYYNLKPQFDQVKRMRGMILKEIPCGSMQ